MGKSLSSPKNLHDFSRIAAAAAAAAAGRVKNPRPASPRPLASPHETSTSTAGAAGRPMEAGERRGDGRLPLSEVVSDCIRRWFQDTLKEARAGDTAMQVLVGQMYQSGYGVARNEQKAKAWITKASRYRSSVWKVSEKRPGYNASDSDSDEMKDDTK